MKKQKKGHVSFFCLRIVYHFKIIIAYRRSKLTQINTHCFFPCFFFLLESDKVFFFKFSIQKWVILLLF